MTTRIRAVSVESWGKNLTEVSCKVKGEEELKIACKDNYFKEFCYKREKRNLVVAGEGVGRAKKKMIKLKSINDYLEKGGGENCWSNAVEWWKGDGIQCRSGAVGLV